MPIPLTAGQQAAQRSSARLRASGAAVGRPVTADAAGGAPTPPTVNPNTTGAPATPYAGPATPTGSQAGPRLPGGASAPAGGPIDPVDVRVGAPTLGDFQSHQDAAYQQFTRTLDPEWSQRDAQLSQALINRGFQPGSEAYNAERDRFSRERTDAYGQARTAAIDAGQRAQQQAFGQNLAESQLANALLTSREGNNTSLSLAGMSNQNAMSQAEIQRQNFLDQLGFNRDQMALGANQWDRQFGLGQQQWQDQFGLQSQQADMANLMQLLGYDFNAQQYNGQQQQQDLQNAAGFFGFMPQGGPAQVDAITPYQMQQQGQQANYQNQIAQQNGMMGALGSIGSAFLLCDRDAKRELGPADPAASMSALRRMPLVEFTYRADVTQRPFVGVYAQDFGNAVHGDPRTNIAVLDALGLVLGSLKDLDRRVMALEPRAVPATPTTPTNTTEH